MNSDKEIRKDEEDVIDGKLLEVSNDEEIELVSEEETKVSPKNADKISFPKTKNQKLKTEKPKDSKAWIQYIVVPFLFLFVTLLGGLRLSAVESDLLFLKPALVCLIFGVILVILFFRSRLIQMEGWFSENFTPLQNTANACVLITLFAASTQVFNSLIPEKGLPFWIIAFFFFWSLWTNLFAEFDTKKLLVSLGSLFGLAFITKYLILSSLIAPGEGGFFQALLSGNLTKETITYLLDLPRFANGTGYIQFFTIIFYLIGLFLLRPQIISDNANQNN